MQRWPRAVPAALHATALFDRIDRAIEPFDAAGLLDRTRRDWYPVLASDLVASASKLEASIDDVNRLLERCGLAPCANWLNPDVVGEHSYPCHRTSLEGTGDRLTTEETELTEIEVNGGARLGRDILERLVGSPAFWPAIRVEGHAARTRPR